MQAMDYEGVRVCSVEHVNTGRVCKWPTQKITWTILNVLPGFTPMLFKETCAEAFAKWAAVCGIEPEYTPNARAANILIDIGYIDGPAGTLAWSEMPCGNGVRQCRQRYDTGDRWVVSIRAVANKIDLSRVLLHEIGHALGIPHLEDGNVMQASFSWQIAELQAGDIRAAVLRYGSAKSSPSAPLPPRKGDDSMDAKKLKEQIDALLGVLSWLAMMTPNKVDDGVVTFLKFVSEALGKLAGGEMTAEQFSAAIKAHVEAPVAA